MTSSPPTGGARRAFVVDMLAVRWKVEVCDPDRAAKASADATHGHDYRGRLGLGAQWAKPTRLPFAFRVMHSTRNPC